MLSFKRCIAIEIHKFTLKTYYRHELSIPNNLRQHVLATVQEQLNVVISSRFVKRVIAQFDEAGSVDRKERKKSKDRRT